MLLFEKEDGTAHPFEARRLARLLHGFPSLRLVVLNACHTADAAGMQGTNPFAGVASALVSDGPQRAELINGTAADYQALRDSRAGRSDKELVPIDEARANAFPYDPAGKAPPPLRPGSQHFGEWPLRDLRSHIDWTPFFRAWELAGTYPAILDDPVVGESARNLFDDAQEMLNRIIFEHWLQPKGTVGLWRCRREGDDVWVLGGNEEVRVPFLRQQVRKREGRANMCLADFIDHEATRTIVFFGRPPV